MIWWAVYLLASWWAFRTILRSWFKDFGPEWTGVGFALFGLIPVAGQVVAVALADWKVPSPKVAVPAWLKQIGGVE